MDSAGNLYGTTSGGGTAPTGATGAFSLGFGTVYEVTAAGVEYVLYSFQGGVDGEYPASGLISDGAGNLYGTTVGGGAHNQGTVFKITIY